MRDDLKVGDIVKLIELSDAYKPFAKFIYTISRFNGEMIYVTCKEVVDVKGNNRWEIGKELCFVEKAIQLYYEYDIEEIIDNLTKLQNKIIRNYDKI